MMPHRMLFILLFLVITGVGLWLIFRPYERWAVYYGNALTAEVFAPYDLVVLDRAGHPPLEVLRARHKTLLGYISLTEAETSRSDYASIKEKHMLLDTGPAWKGNPIIDIRKPEWNAYVLDVLIPDILTRFDGIMIDTSDSAIYLENTDPTKYPGLKAALVKLIKQIRVHYPYIKIMMNRGFEIVPQVENDIDMVLAESIYANGNMNTPGLVPAEVYQGISKELKEAQLRSGHLKVYTVDYWPISDKAGVKRIYAAQRTQGFIPYVSDPALQTIIPEP